MKKSIVRYSGSLYYILLQMISYNNVTYYTTSIEYFYACGLFLLLDTIFRITTNINI